MPKEFKPCKDYQYRDPVSNRCKNREDYKPVRKSPPKEYDNTKKPQYKPCKEHQYRDPDTNRCRNKEAHRKSPPKDVGDNSKYKPCKEHQYRDPDTNRCKNKEDYKRDRKKPNKPKKVRDIDRPPPPPRWVNVSKQIDSCIMRSKLKLRDFQVKVVQYMDEHDGLLVMHGTGTGKTLTAITTSQCYLDKYPDNKVVFLGPASLASNFKKEMNNYGLLNLQQYEFYSFDKFYSEFRAKKIDLTNKMLVIDEAHNLRNPVGKKSIVVVNAAEKADKRLLLSATPFVNNLMDFIPLINIIYGRKIVGTPQEFYENETPEFIGKKATLENLTTLRYLMRDKVDVVARPVTVDYPERLDIMQNVPMSMEYYERYNRLVDGEDMFGILFTSPEKFYHAYRRAVNRAGPDYYSAKIDHAVNILKEGKSLIYTNWVEFGIRPITDALTKHKITYKLFYGEVPIEQRQEIVNDFNSNKFQVLVITKAGGEGLDLKGVKSVVVMDPTWNDASLQQIVGRAIRYKSHVHLPLDEQKVSVYFMLLTIPLEIQAKTTYAASGDVLLYNIIEKKNEINAGVVAILEDMSL